MEHIKTSVKVVGTNGQISLGKQFAGRQVLIEEEESGVWKIRTASIVPDNEKWLHEKQMSDSLTRALHQAQRHKPTATTDLDALFKELEYEREESTA
jgi:hypothetical protein